MKIVYRYNILYLKIYCQKRDIKNVFFFFLQSRINTILLISLILGIVSEEDGFIKAIDNVLVKI